MDETGKILKYIYCMYTIPHTRDDWFIYKHSRKQNPKHFLKEYIAADTQQQTIDIQCVPSKWLKTSYNLEQVTVCHPVKRILRAYKVHGYTDIN